MQSRPMFHHKGDIYVVDRCEIIVWSGVRHENPQPIRQFLIDCYSHSRSITDPYTSRNEHDVRTLVGNFFAEAVAHALIRKVDM